MIKLRMTIVFLTLWGALSGWGQGFGDRKLINVDRYLDLGSTRYSGAELFDHSEWRKLELPHDWSVESVASPSLASCTGHLPSGIGWYRKDSNIPKNKEGNKACVYFEGVYNNSEVFINGKWVGKRPGGYVSFTYDLTPYLDLGKRNVPAVRVDRLQDADSRWYTGSGIYRDIYLVYANLVHIGLWGVSYSAKVNQKNVVLSVQAEVGNTDKMPVTVKMLHEVFDHDGKRVGVGNRDYSLKTDEMVKKELIIFVAQPKLWNLENPYPYTIKTVLSEGGEVIDRTEIQAGTRPLAFDPNKGFVLNGKLIKVKGVCIRHDTRCLGIAVLKEVWRRRSLQLEEIGCNAVRIDHNPQITCVHKLCDELGILIKDGVFDEWEYAKKKWVTGWDKGKPGSQGSASYFRGQSRKDLANMIRRDRSHPSIIIWSIGNEADYPNDPCSHPILNQAEVGQQYVKGYQKEQPRTERLGDIAKELMGEAKKHDSSRPVTAALADVAMFNETDYPAALDVVGYNYTESQYQIDHEKYPNRILYGSEARHGLNAWKAVRDNDFIFRQFIWIGFDYLGEAGPQPSRRLAVGMIDLTGNIEPNGYFHRALWLESPTVYVGAHKIESAKKKPSVSASVVWNYESGDTTRVVAYTNCEKAELLLNGKKVGERKPYDNSAAIIYRDIPYTPGALKVVVYNQRNVVAKDKVQSSGLPYAIRTSADKTQDIRVGEVLHLMIQIVDEDSIPVVLVDNQITCKTEGEVGLLGLKSGDHNVADNYRDNKQWCKNDKLLGYIKVTRQGKVRMRLTSPLLQPTIWELSVE